MNIFLQRFGLDTPFWNYFNILSKVEIMKKIMGWLPHINLIFCFANSNIFLLSFEVPVTYYQFYVYKSIFFI